MKHEHTAATVAVRRAAHRVAVIGHGPAAIETSDLLICMGDYFVDLFSEAPAPTCLIRFGSTHRAGGARSDGRSTAANLVPRLRLFGNVHVGSGNSAVSVGELTHYYDTVIVANESPSGKGTPDSGLVVVGASPAATATFEFLRAHTSLPLSRTPVVTEIAAADRPGAIIALLESRAIPFTTWQGWHRPAWAHPSSGTAAVQPKPEHHAAESLVTVAQWRTLIAGGLAVPDVP